LNVDIDDSSSAKASKAIKHLISHAKFQRFSNKILKAYDKLGDRSYVAVLKHSGGSSRRIIAGQQATFLNISGEANGECGARCVTSLFEARAIL
jgi:phosphoenolpyruvate synthase/pyruvate phosphate dikinase